MGVEVDIPGGKAVLRDRSELRARDRNMVRAALLSAAKVFAKIPTETLEKAAKTNSLLALSEVDMTEDEAARLDRANEAVVLARLVSWTLPMPLPTRDTIRDLPPDLYDALINVAGTADFVLAPVDFSPGPVSEQDRRYI